MVSIHKLENPQNQLATLKGPTDHVKTLKVPAKGVSVELIYIHHQSSHKRGRLKALCQELIDEEKPHMSFLISFLIY